MIIGVTRKVIVILKKMGFYFLCIILLIFCSINVYNFLFTNDFEQAINKNFIIVTNCSDGSQIIDFYTHKLQKKINIRYVPPKISDKKYDFFKKFTISDQIKYKSKNIEIPVCINDSGDYRFVVKAHKGIGKIIIDDLVLLNKEDIDFNNMYSRLRFDGRDEYIISILPKTNLSAEDQTEFLKACVFNGNINVLDSLANLMTSDIETKYRLELATSNFSDTNPYVPKIYYQDDLTSFPQQDTFNLLIKSLQTRKEITELGAVEVTPNFNEFYYKLPNSNSDNIYKLDLNKDGVDEISTITDAPISENKLLDIFSLDNSDNIANTIYSKSTPFGSIYSFRGNYFFVYPIKDYGEDYTIGYSVLAFDQEYKAYEMDIVLEKIDSKIIFDEAANINVDINISEIDNAINTYKQHEHKPIGNQITPNNQLVKMFRHDEATLYGTFDMNNDGVDDWTSVYMLLLPHTSYIHSEYKFIDGKTNELVNFSTMLDKRGDYLKFVTPYKSDDKNYFICGYYGHDKYVIKLIEFDGTTPIVLHDWLIAIENRIVISNSQYE